MSGFVLTWTRAELKRHGRYYADWAQRYLDRDDDCESEELCTLLCALRDVADVAAMLPDDDAAPVPSDVAEIEGTVGE